jgi:outer membrane protein assembly factor BamA
VKRRRQSRIPADAGVDKEQYKLITQNITARIRNALGGAESLELNASIGTKTKSAYQATFSTPVMASPLLQFSVQAFSFDRDNTAFASHREEARGGRVKFSVSVVLYICVRTEGDGQGRGREGSVSEWAGGVL